MTVSTLVVAVNELEKFETKIVFLLFLCHSPGKVSFIFFFFFFFFFFFGLLFVF